MMVLFNEIAEEDNNQSEDSQGDGENHQKFWLKTFNSLGIFQEKQCKDAQLV